MPRPLNPNNYHGFRTLVLRRDGKKCVKCGSTENLEVDHILPFSSHPESRYDVSNGSVLCNTCHRLTDTYGGASKRSTAGKGSHGTR
jgi:5-methylcytosine-specific restriction endonuclease McrA